MKIKSYQDLRPGDVWLGQTVRKCDDHSIWFSTAASGLYLYSQMAQALIDHGYDEVERTPEQVTFSTEVFQSGAAARIGYMPGDQQLEPFIGEKVEVTVRKI